MKKISIILGAVVMIAMMLSSCGDAPIETRIGKQIWMAEDLNIKVFLNGDSILRVNTESELDQANEDGIPCYNEFNGKFWYNWYAVNDPRGLSPKGWHIPGNGEWKTAIESIDSSKVPDFIDGVIEGAPFFPSPCDYCWWTTTEAKKNKWKSGIGCAVYPNKSVDGLSLTNRYPDCDIALVRCVKD